MSAKKDDKLLQELRDQAAKWIEQEFPNRMSSVGVEEAQVRQQLETEAEQWVQYNLEERGQGREGTPSPDALLEQEGALDPTLRGPKRS